MRAPQPPAIRFALLIALLLPTIAGANLDPSVTQKQKVPPPRNTGELLIQFRPGTSASTRDSILGDLGIARMDALPRLSAGRARPARVSVDEAIRRYQDHPAIAFIEPDVIVKTLAIPNDPNFRTLWGMRNTGQSDGVPGADIGVTSVWDRITGSGSVLVAITDTGIDWRHPDLAPNVWTNPGEIPGNGIDDDGNGFVDDVRGWDFVSNDANPMDDMGHGTHVAGTIGAVGNNALGVTGVNWHVRLMPLKFLNASGEGSISDGIKAIDYAVRMGARVINASWGDHSQSEALRQAIERAGEAGVLLVAASGNDGVNNDGGDFYGPPNYPASYDLPNIISVGAFDYRQGMMWWSNYGVKSVDLCAPGVSILSTIPHAQYGYNTGTSMASPHVAGVAALVLAQHPNADAVEVKDLILAGAVPVSAWQGLTVTGGRLDAVGALSDRDSIAPAPVGDLAGRDANGTRLTLRWTASGDDGGAGQARRYDLRMATSPIDANNFASAMPVRGVAAPGLPGTAESFEVRGLAYATTYYFAMKVRDECGNASALSNVARVTTLARPEIDVATTPIQVDLVTNQTATRSVTIANAGPSEMRVHLSSLRSWFSPQPHDTVIAAGRQLVESIRFDATGLGSGDYGGTIDVASDDADEPQVSVPLALHVTGVPDLSADRDRLDFGEVVIGQHAQLAVGVSNAGSEPLRVDSLVSSDGSFTLDPSKLTIQANRYSGFAVKFAPTAIAPYSGSVTLTSNDPDTPVLTIPVTGRGIPAPHAVVEPRAFADTLASWGTVTRTLVLRNPQGSDLQFQIGGGAGWLSFAPATGRIPPGDSARVAVTISATDLPESTFAGTVEVTTNDPSLPRVQVAVRLEVRAAPDIVLSRAPRSNESTIDYFSASGVVAPFEATTVHELQVPGRTVGAAKIEVSSAGGYFRGGRLEIEGAYIGSLTRTGPCTFSRSEFFLPEAELGRVAADGVVNASVISYDPPSQLCPTDQHWVRITWSPALDVLDFGSEWVGGNASQVVKIQNRGFRPLHVAPPANLPPFSIDETTALTIAPGDTGTFTVRFRPVTAGPSEATLTVISDDPDQGVIAVKVKGQAAVAPDAAASLTRLDGRQPSGGHMSQPLVLTNRGGSDLVFDVEVANAAALRNSRTRAVPGAIAERSSAASSADGAWVLLVEDVDPWDFWSSNVNQYVLEADGIRYMQVSSSALATIDLGLFTKIIVSGDQPSSLYRNVQATMPQLTDFVYKGGTLEFRTGYGWADGNASLVTLPRGARATEVWGWTNVAPDPSHPLMAGVENPIVANGREVNVSLATYTNVPDDAERVTLDDCGNPTLITYRHGAGTVIASGQALEIGWYRSWGQRPLLENLIPYLAGSRRDWLTTGKWNGTIPPGGSATISFDLDARSLAAGDHQASIVVNTNDPAHPRITVPVRFTVDAAPDIAVEGPPVTLDSFQPFQGDGAVTVHTFPVPARAAGNGTLEVTAIGDFGERDEFANVRLEGPLMGQARVSGKTVSIPVTAAALERAAADGRIDVEIRNERSVGTTAFQINEHRVRLSWPTGANRIPFGTVFLGQSVERRIQVTNRGSLDLHLAPPVASDAVFHVDAAAATIGPGETHSLTVIFSPVAAGAIEGRITLRSDDPDQPEVVVPVGGEGVPAPVVALAPDRMSIAMLRGETATQPLRMANDGGTPLDYRIEIESGDAAPVMARAPVATPVAADTWARIRERYQSFRSAHATSIVRPAPAKRTAITTPERPVEAEAVATVTAAGNATDVFFDDMEHGENGWTHSPTSSDGVDYWTLSSVRTASGRRSWQVMPHEAEGSDALVSPVIDLTAHAQASLTFATWYAFDDCVGTPGYEPDGGLVEVSVEGSGAWTPVAPEEGYPFVLDDACYDPLGGRPAFAHHSAAGDSFVTERVDLSEFAGRRIRIRFQAGWDCGNCDVPNGWFIDDVRVSTDGPKWVTALPAQGRIAAGDLADPTITFTSAGISPGTHTAQLRVRSNDPVQPVVTVPLALTIADFAATLDVTPNVVNLGRRGKWLTLSIELPDGGDPAAITVSSLRLNQVAAADPTSVSIGDHDHDRISDLTVRFAIDDLRSTFNPSAPRRVPGGGDDVPLLLTGSLRDSRSLLGRATVRVLRPRLAIAGPAVLAPGSLADVSWVMPDDWAASTATLSLSRNGGIGWEAVAAGIGESRWGWKVPDATTRHALLRAEFRDADGVLATAVLDQSFAIGAAAPSAESDAPRIERLALRCAPNPFAGGTDITLALPHRGPVELGVFSVSGQRVGTPVRGTHEAGILRVRWEARDARGAQLPAGIYFLRVESPDGVVTKRVTLLR